MDPDVKADMLQHLNAITKGFGDEPLLVTPTGDIINLAQGYVPLYVDFTIEDKAAKGLRQGKDGHGVEAPVYFSAADAVLDNRFLLLTGPSGSGKTTFAKHLAWSLSGEADSSDFPRARPYYCTINGPDAMKTFLYNSVLGVLEVAEAAKSDLLIIFDNLEHLNEEGPGLLAKLVELIKPYRQARLLLLGDSGILKQWTIPTDIIRHDLRPLLGDQRLQAMVSLTGLLSLQPTTGLGAVAALPIYFALSIEADNPGECAEELLDEWLAVVASEEEACQSLTGGAFETLYCASTVKRSIPSSSRHPLFSKTVVQHLLAARHLVNTPLDTSINMFHQDPVISEATIRSLLARLDSVARTVLLQGLISGTNHQMQLGALLCSDFISDDSHLLDQISSHMLAIIQEGTLSILQRENAGRVLSRLGDPRELTRLVAIPAGEVMLGADDHPNSQPTATVLLDSFQIGEYPVVNRDYNRFVRDTGREWHSPDGMNVETQNAPATDLTWYDTLAYCKWLTRTWQSEGRIGHDEHVRLPSEPEWERAARGDQRSSVYGDTIYPWGTKWKHDATNYEETGFNKRISVGLFPAGRSPYGCYDMAGQVWEWCTTLWGESTATPSFGYPWRGDGRECLDASGSIRRVLRGGCFSSTRLKASCTYRGSLELAGFWRGNGFRIVVARLPPS